MENRAERGDIIGIDSLFRRKLERRREREGEGGVVVWWENQTRARYRGGQRFERYFFFKVPHKMDDTQNTELLWGLHEM